MAPETNVSSRRDAAPAHDGFRTPLAEKVFLDRYALEATDRDAIREGDIVVYCPNPEAEGKRRRREIGVVILDRQGHYLLHPHEGLFLPAEDEAPHTWSPKSWLGASPLYAKLLTDRGRSSSSARRVSPWRKRPPPLPATCPPRTPK